MDNIGDRQLIEILNRFRGELSGYFQQKYGEHFISENEGNGAIFDGQNAALILAWEILDDISWHDYQQWNRQSIKDE